MEHYIAYQAAEWGPFSGSSFFTAKRFRRETLIGHRLWVVQGEESPTRYTLVSSGVITGVSDGERPPQYSRPGRNLGKNVSFDPENNVRVDLTGRPWFTQLKRQQQSFRYGLARITDKAVVQSLLQIWPNAHYDDEESISKDLDEIRTNKSLNSTTREALIDARLGQGAFRRKLMIRWDSICAVTGCNVSSLLRASHVKPWKYANNSERLDQANGLLLAVHIDALFDSGLVSFADNGEMLVAKRVPFAVAEMFQLPQSLRMPLKSAEKKYLRYHRQKFEKANESSA